MKNGFRRLTAIFMTALMLLAVVPVGALGAEQYSKSIIPAIDLARIIQPDDTPVATYIFYNGTAEYARQSVKNTEELYKPQTPPAAEGTVFTGWAREDGTLFDSFGPQTVTETVEIKLYAKFDKAYYVYFYTPDGATLKHTEVVTDNTQTYDFSYVTYEVGSTKKVTGWAAEKNGTVDVSKNVTFGGKTSVSLYAIETEGYWVIFHTGEGSVVPPMFGPAGTTLSLQDVAAPTRVGYTFGGWYDNQAGTGTPIQQVNSATEVYAKWNPAQVNYTVIHWHENANDDQYSFKEMETKNGTTDGQTNAAAKSYDGFTAQTITQKTIRGDGSTIVNVYYKRNVYDVKFYEYKSREWQEIAKLRITAKYEANIEDKWPTYNDSSTWATGGNFFGSLSGPYQVNLFKMPLGGKNFYGPKTGNGSESAYYYVEVIPGESGETTLHGVAYKLHHKDTSPGTNYVVTAEDQYSLEGYTYTEGTQIGSAYNNAKFYYTRNQYVITFINGGVTDKTVNKKYEQSIEDADYTPANPPAGKDGYVFDGWHDNELGEGEQYVFTGKTMPARNITLYAKWSAPTHKVTFDLGYDAPSEATTPPTQTVQHRKTAQQPEDPTRDGFSFTGWYDEDGSPFNFATLIVKDVKLTAHWLSNSTFKVEYDKNGGDGTVPEDNVQYADGAGATVKDKGGLTHPKGMVFLGWATVAANPTTIYQPGDKLPIDASMATNGIITLYAVWGDKPVQTKLTYNANFGETPAEKVYYELENNATVTILDYDNAELGLPLRPGYEFLGWSEDPKAKETDKLYKAGDKIIVDETDAPTKNVLFAIWKQSTVKLTVTKTVTGNFGDKSKAFEFSMKVDNGDNSFGLTVNGKALTKGTQGDYTFSLKDGENIVIEGMPVGKKIVLAETNAEQYTVSFNDTVETNRNYVNEKGLTADTEIAVVNYRYTQPDTGVFVDSLPYILIIACVAGVAALFLIRRRKKRED